MTIKKRKLKNSNWASDFPDFAALVKIVVHNSDLMAPDTLPKMDINFYISMKPTI